MYSIDIKRAAVQVKMGCAVQVQVPGLQFEPGLIRVKLGSARQAQAAAVGIITLQNGQNKASAIVDGMCHQHGIAGCRRQKAAGGKLPP